MGLTMKIHLKENQFLFVITLTKMTLLTNNLKWRDSTRQNFLCLMSTGLRGVEVAHGSTECRLASPFLWSSVLNLYNCLWKRQSDIITSAWTWWKNSLHCLTWLLKKYVFCYTLLSRWGTNREICWKNIRTVLHGLLQKHFKMRAILSYAWISAF
jgi:hypothetical protein